MADFWCELFSGFAEDCLFAVSSHWHRERRRWGEERERKEETQEEISHPYKALVLSEQGPTLKILFTFNSLLKTLSSDK